MKATLFLTSLLFSTGIFSQEMILHDPISGRVFSSERYSGINGSPFLFDKWITGSVTIDKGVYRNLELKLDAYSNKLYFNKNDELYEFESEIRSFVLYPKVSDSSSYMYFKSGFQGDGLRSNQFVQVIMEGPINLYKSDLKIVSDVNEINRGVIKTFVNASRHYIQKENKMKSINITKSEILDLVKDKEEKIKAYIDQNKLSTKKTGDLVQILKYYNSL